MQAAVRLQALALAWGLLAVTEGAADSEGDDDDDDVQTDPGAVQLGKQVQAFARQLQVVADECGSDGALLEVVVRAQADLLMVFDAAKLQVTTLSVRDKQKIMQFHDCMSIDTVSISKRCQAMIISSIMASETRCHKAPYHPRPGRPCRLFVANNLVSWE